MCLSELQCSSSFSCARAFLLSDLVLAAAVRSGVSPALVSVSVSIPVAASVPVSSLFLQEPGFVALQLPFLLLQFSEGLDLFPQLPYCFGLLLDVCHLMLDSIQERGAALGFAVVLNLTTGG